MEQLPKAFWSKTAQELNNNLSSGPTGLTEKEAEGRFRQYGANQLQAQKSNNDLRLFLTQFKSPIVILLLLAAVLSFFLSDPMEGLIIILIILVSSFLGFWQERGAAHAVEKLLAMVKIKTKVIRQGQTREIPMEEVVPGDLVVLSAGDVIPGDCLLIEANDLYLNEATLTGETYPVEKFTGVLPETTALSQRTNALWMGTHVVSGSGLGLVIFTGRNTIFGGVSESLKLRPQETEFEIGVKRFGYFLLEVTMVLVIAIFAINVYLAKPVLDSFLFSLALAVGLTPQLLPAIISINLAHGAKRMALQQVIVKRLSAIQNFGSMDILCSDKTGTLTEGVAKLHSALSIEGLPCEKVLHYAYLNAAYETGYSNPIDQAIRGYRSFDLTGYRKKAEIPYDFIRKRLSILVEQEDSKIMITKGALANVLAVCSKAETKNEEVVDLDQVKAKIEEHYTEYSNQGYRILGVAYKNLQFEDSIDKDNETELTFLGFLVFFDPPKPNLIETINNLQALGVNLKIITGDNRLVAATIGHHMGLTETTILTGPEIQQMSDEAMLHRVTKVDVFAEVEPNHKERIILTLRKAGHVVGYMGDGVNDVSAIHGADVGISVEGAVDVAKEAADIVLLEKNLDVLVQGVKAGRLTFANTLKYVFMATSANFGNMFSMAGASLFLNFLPLLPKQILMTNFLTDLPEMTIATDAVDRELVERPRRWDISFIRKFMLTFGLASSLFDYLTFAVLLIFLHANPQQFRTGWFMESVISASLIVLVIRSRRPFYKSKPGKSLILATIAVIIVTLLLPYSFLAPVLGFQPLTPDFLIVLGGILVLYILIVESLKYYFYKRVNY